MNFKEEVYDKYSDKKKEIYDNIKISSSDDAYLGCYIKGHYHTFIFERVALDWLKYGYEIDMDKDSGYMVRQGYFKETPYQEEGEYQQNVLIYKENKVKGSYSITELVFNEEI